MHKILLYAKITARRFSNPVFIGLLGLSLLLWYVTKLSYTYTTDLTVPVRIDSTQYTVRCNVDGVGYQILLHKWSPKKNTIILSADNIAVNPSALVPGAYDISTFALQNIISAKITDLKIKSVEAPVEVERSKNNK